MSKAVVQMKLCCCYNDLASFPGLPTPVFVACSTNVNCAGRPWNEANHDPFSAVGALAKLPPDCTLYKW